MGIRSRSDCCCDGRRRAQPVADGGNSLLDRILEGLSRPRSRRVLYCLAEREPRDLDDLAAAVAELEVCGEATDEQREQVKVAIYHNVLPKLADLKLLEYDARSQTVCFRESPAELDEFVRLCRQFDTDECGTSGPQPC